MWYFVEPYAIMEKSFLVGLFVAPFVWLGEFVAPFVWLGEFYFGLFYWGCEAILVRETPAQFAVYKSPEQGLNLSRS